MPVKTDLKPKLIKRLKLRKVFFCFVAVICLQSPLQAAEPPIDGFIQKSASYLYDPDSKFSIEEIRSPRFEGLFKAIPDFHQTPGLKSGVLWLKITVSNSDTHEYKGVLSFDAPQLGSVRLFAPDTNSAESATSWDSLPNRTIYPAFPNFVPPGKTQNSYVRIANNSFPEIYMNLEPAADFKERMDRVVTFLNAYFGFFAALFLVNFLVYLYGREKSYLYYLAFEGAIGINFFLGSGLAGSHFPWLRTGLWGLFPFVYVVASANALLFTRSFLDLNTRMPRADRVLRSILTLYPLLAVMALIPRFTVISVAVNTFLVALSMPLQITLGVLIWRKGYLAARSFILAWSFLAFWIFIWILAQLKILPHNMATFNAPLIGSAGEMLLLSLAVFDKMSSLKYELIASQEALNRSLEAKVQERTRELEDSNRALEAQRAAALNASKMATLGEMAGGVAHEINNPLAIIRLLSGRVRELSKDPHPDLAVIERSLAQIDPSVVRISDIIGSLLSFSKRDGDTKVQPVAIQEVIDRTLHLCREDISRRGILFEVDPVPASWKIECQEGQIRQILLNLITNAADAVGGKKGAWIRLSVQEEIDGVSFSVMDSGSGIPKSIQDRIMEPFFTTKEIGQGTGLGLSVAQGIAEKHHGKLTLDTTSNHTRFVLWLPSLLAFDEAQLHSVSANSHAKA